MAKRVNKRFLVALTAVVLVGGVTAMVAAYVLPRIFKKDPQELVAESKRLEAEYDQSVRQGTPDRNKAESAIMKYAAAVQADQKNPGLRIGLGDLVYRHLALDPRQYPSQARRSWEDALVVDPGNREAMGRLLDMYWDFAMAQPSIESFTQVRDAANRVLGVDPGNAEALARLHIATVRQAQVNPIPNTAEVEESVKALRELWAKEPANAKLPLWAAQGEVYLATQALKRSVTGRAEAKRIVDRLEQSLPGMLKGQEGNAEMQFYVAQIYQQMPGLDAAMRSGPTTRPAGSPAGKYTDRVTAGFTAARQHAKPPKPGDDPDDRNLFFDIQLANVQWLSQLGKADESRKVLEELAARYGDEPRVRMAYSSVFRSDPTKREKIRELLARPVPMDGYTGLHALDRKSRESGLRFEAATLRLASLDAQADPAARKKVVEEVEAEARQLEQTVPPQAPAMLELRGRLHLAQGRMGEAIPLLQQAVDLRGGQARDTETLQLMVHLADAYARQGLTGQAEKTLAEAVARFPGYIPLRVARVQALVQDGRKSDARQQLAELKKVAPNAKEIAALEAAVEGGEKLSAMVEQMPEGTSVERLRKAVNLRAEGKVEEAVALAEQAVKEDPKNVQALQLLVDMYLRADRREDALAAVNAAIKANPDNEQLKRWPDVLVRRSPEEYEQWALEQIKQDPDVVSREVKLHQYAMSKAAAAAQRGDDAERKRQIAEAERHLAAAERTKPDDLGLVARRFEFLAGQQRFDEAERTLQRLSAANADQLGGQLFRYQLAMAKARAARGAGNAAGLNAGYAEAEAAALEMTRQRPQFDTGWQCLAAVMQARGRHREAVQYYNNALERRGRNYEALRGIAEAHYALGEPAAAKAALTRARDMFPRDAALRELLLAHELNNGGDLAKVAAERERVLKDEPNNAANAVALAETYLRQAGTTEDKAKQKELAGKSRALLQDGYKRWPADVRFALPLAQLMLQDGDFIGGEKLLKDFAAQPAVSDKAAADGVLAEYYVRANKPALAEQSLRDAVAKSGGAAAAKQQLARLLAATNRPDEAVKELEGVAGADAARLRVQCLLAAKKPEAAEEALKAAVAADPNNAELSNFQIELLIDTGRLAQAEPLVQQRVARSDADDQARYYGALIKLRKQPGDVPGAVKDLTDLADRNPRSLQVLTLLADTRAASNDIASAVDDLERALRLAPQSRDLRLKMIEWSAALGRWETVRKLAAESAAHPELGKDPAWHRALARANAATGNFADAEKAITKAIGMVPPDKAGDLRREHLAVLHQAKNYPRVLQLTDEMLAKGTKDWWVHQYRGMAKAGAKDKTAGQEFDAALASLDPEKQFPAAQAVVDTIAATLGHDEALKRVAKWESTSPRWRFAAANLCFQKGDIAGSLARLQPMEAEAGKLPDDLRAPFYRALANTYQQLQPRPDFEKAAAAYQQYLKLQPGDVTALNNLAYILAEELSPPRPQEAKQYSRVAYEIARGWRAGDAKARIFDTHGWTLVLSGESDLDEGIRVLRQVVDDFPIVEAHYHLGEAQLRKNRAAEAQAQFNAALALMERSKKAKQPVDEALEPKIRRGLQNAKTLGAAAAAGGR